MKWENKRAMIWCAVSGFVGFVIGLVWAVTWIVENSHGTIQIPGIP